MRTTAVFDPFAPLPADPPSIPVRSRVQVRAMIPEDCAAVARLLPELGHAGSSVDMQRRFAIIEPRRDHACFVAEDERGLVGWCHVYGVRLLASDGYAEIGGIVTAPRARRSGTATALVLAAETWADAHGHGRLRLRSSMHRAEAHAFYKALGYERSRASFAFEVHLPRATPE